MNWVAPTLPWPTARVAVPKAAVDLPLPLPVKTIRMPFLLRCRRHAGSHLRFQLLLALTMAVGIASRVHKCSLVSCRTGGAAVLLLELAKEVVAFVVNQHKRGQIFDFHHPYRFHAQLRILQAAQTFHILLRQQGRRAADAAEIKPPCLWQASVTCWLRLPLKA